MYIRDIPFLNIDGKYPFGHCYNEYEAMISVPNWNADKSQVVASVNHELHHMARWKNPGYGETLGGALLSEGIATYYEEKVSGWSPPWTKAQVSNDSVEVALQEWDDKEYDHNAWFFEGPYGKWVGYGLGYRLAKKVFANDFELARSIQIAPEEAHGLLKSLSLTS